MENSADEQRGDLRQNRLSGGKAGRERHGGGSAARQTDQADHPFGEAVADRTGAVDLFEIRFAHHAPGIGRAGQREGDTLADHRDMAIVRIAWVSDVEVAAALDRLAYTGVKHAGRRVIEGSSNSVWLRT